MNTKSQQNAMSQSGPLAELLQRIAVVEETLLKSREIFEFDTYGWLDHDTIDPEYLGHAIFHTSPPYEPDWSALFGDNVASMPSKKQEILAKNGEDFVGTMKYARRSIGRTLLQADQYMNPSTSDFPEAFRYECQTSLLWLNIASERLRDYFVTGTLGLEALEAYKTKKSRTPYSDPFDAAVPSSEAEQDMLRAASELARTIQEFRKVRNTATHGIASQQSEVMVEALQRQRELAEAGVRYDPLADLSLEEIADCQPKSTPSDFPIQTANLTEWYKALIDASDLVFRFTQSRRTEP